MTCNLACPPIGYYVDTNNNCGLCDSTCSTCNGAATTNCLTCNPSGSTKYYMNSNTTCITSCPLGYYGDANNDCKLCDSTCSTCDGSTATNCLTCYTAGPNKYYILHFSLSFYRILY